MRDPKGQRLTLTKIDAAEAQLKTAVRMYFENGHLAPIFTLANAVREVAWQIGDHLDVETVQEGKIANFFKHADCDPTDTIDIEDDDAEMTLYLACHDFGRVADGMPIEAQVFEAWAYTANIKRVSDAPLRVQKLIRRAIVAFPGLRRATDRAAQKRIGLETMERALKDKSLEMTIRRLVPEKAKLTE
jgi:hypothetical protein